MRDIDVGELLENARLGPFQLSTLALCVLILYVDGLDFSAIGVGAPSILRALNAERSAMAIVFSLGYFGILVGSFLFGYLGDKYGRRAGAILGVLAYSIPALLTVFATSLDQLAAFRFLSGLGIGGVVPNVIALLTETSPKKYRVTFVMVAYIGYSLGNASCGQVAAWLIPVYGWTIVFAVAGAAGLALSIALYFLLPESIPYLALTAPDSPHLAKSVRLALPERHDHESARYIVRRRTEGTRFALRLLFSEYRRIATPLLWAAFFAESLTYMTLTAWIAVIVEQAGLMPVQASMTFTYAYIGATIAIFVLARFIDAFGPRVSVVSAAIAMAALVFLGTPGMTAATITIVAIIAIACSSATHQALNGIVGGFYPTAIRGNGVGYATGMGRAAAIVGPAIAGNLLSADLPLQIVMTAIAAPYTAVIVICLVLDRLQKRISADSPASSVDGLPGVSPREQTG